MKNARDSNRQRGPMGAPGARPAPRALAVVLFLLALAARANAAPNAEPNTASNPAPNPAAMRAADEAVLEARKAFFKGDAARVAAQARSAQSSVLAAYPELWQIALALRAGRTEDAQVQAFLERHAGEVVADRMRLEWLLALGARGDYTRFVAERHLLPAGVEDAQLSCHEWIARYTLVPEDARAAIALDARRFLAATSEPAGDGCTALAARLLDDGRLEVWPRLQALLERGQSSAAQRLATRLPAGQSALFRRMLERPEGWLAANLDKVDEASRPVALLALVLVSRDHAERAAELADRLEPKLSGSERAMAWGRIGHMAQQDRLDQAVEWFARGGEGVGHGPDYVRAGEVLESSARALVGRAGATGCPQAALGEGEERERWASLLVATGRISADQRGEPTWAYWTGCALMAVGRPDEAKASWRLVADRMGFYGRLAAEELGQPLLLPPAPDAPKEEDIARLAALPCFERARHFLELGLREEGNREWAAGLRGLDDRGLLAAAEVGARMGLPDRMIASSERTRDLVDIGQRFPVPHRERLMAITSPLAIDPSWVYGLIRQESRFIEGVRSSAGAVGLMQIMPSTASYVARRIGLPGGGGSSGGSRFLDVDINLRLGSEYLKLVFDDQDGREVLATAAYNAGPRRVRRWRASLSGPTEGAAFVETIPIPETRDYTRKVLYNTVVYRALLDAPPRSLHALLGTITPHEVVENDLP
jgi:soluble lytic murein transglycosylase